jgi:hypothetical protein
MWELSTFLNKVITLKNGEQYGHNIDCLFRVIVMMDDIKE